MEDHFFFPILSPSNQPSLCLLSRALALPTQGLGFYTVQNWMLVGSRRCEKEELEICTGIKEKEKHSVNKRGKWKGKREREGKMMES